MSEYMEKHTVSRLFGAPPGYVSHESSGQLTESVRRKPSSVVLFDEIEKAHPSVFNSLLQILDYGALTEGTGRKADFRNAIIIMTSNIGQGIVISSKQSGEDDEAKLKIAEELKASYRAEFLNRIDEIVIFRALKQEEVKKIVEIMISEVAERIRVSKGIEIKVEDDLKNKVIKRRV